MDANLRHGSDPYGTGAGAPTASSQPQQQQHPHHPQASASSSHFPSAGTREDTDMVVQAIDKLGNKVGSQLSSLSVQMSSMLSMMSQLVELNQAQQRSRFTRYDAPQTAEGPTAGPGPSSWHHQQQQSQQQQQHAGSNTTRQPAMFRRDSGHPFAFDPALDQDESSSFHPNPSRHDLPHPPHTADSAVVQSHLNANNPNGMGIYLGSSDASEPPHSRQVSAADMSMQQVQSQQQQHHHHHSTSHLVPIPPPPQQSHGTLDDASMLTHSLSFDQALPTGGTGMDAGPEGPGGSPRRPASAYGSVRPFTAVDHSSRPAPPPPIPPPQPPQHLSGFEGTSSGAGGSDEQDRMRMDFELQAGGGQPHYNQENVGPGAGVSPDFGRPPTRNPTHRYPLDMVGVDAGGQRSRDDEHDHYQQQYSQHQGFPGQSQFSSYGQSQDSPPKSSLLALAGEDSGSSPRRVGRPPGPAIGALARKKSTSRDTPLLGPLPPRMDQSLSSQAGISSPPAGGGESGVSSAPMGDWRMWANSPPRPSETKLRGLPEPKWRTLQSARLDLQRKTGRTMAKLGRLPLKDYLEVSQPEYLAARKTGRAAYNEWLLPLVRLAKQDAERVRACTNFIEYSHPMLSLCEASFKARQLLQQIIDNAIDESTNAKKKGGGVGGGTPGGGPAGQQSGNSQRAGGGGAGSSSATGAVAQSQAGSTGSGVGGNGSYDRGDSPDDSMSGQHSTFSASPTVMNDSSGGAASYFNGGGGDSHESGTGGGVSLDPQSPSDLKSSANGYTATQSPSSTSIHLTRSSTNGANGGMAGASSPANGLRSHLPGSIGRFASPRSLSRGIHRVEPYPSVNGGLSSLGAVSKER